MAAKIVIVISGMPGCGSTTTGKLLADKLKMEFFSVGTYFKNLDEDKWMDAYYRETATSIELWKSDIGKKIQFTKEGSLNKLEQLQIDKAKKGSIVIESKLGIRFLKAYATLTVWLKAPLETRVTRYAQREGVTLEEAAQLLREKETLERENFKKIYGFDFFVQEKEADVVIDTSDKAPGEIVGAILARMKKA
ncbi:MAG: cytidylate kinase family protein [Candidatus Aenigmarchaeota archaeon]|nr:cytidylate kinase family protein [Candidatus Aenigmarchaeota archaeon]